MPDRARGPCRSWWEILHTDLLLIYYIHEWLNGTLRRFSKSRTIRLNASLPSANCICPTLYARPNSKVNIFIVCAHPYWMAETRERGRVWFVSNLGEPPCVVQSQMTAAPVTWAAIAKTRGISTTPYHRTEAKSNNSSKRKSRRGVQLRRKYRGLHNIFTLMAIGRHVSFF